MGSNELGTAFAWEVVRASGQELEGDFAGAVQTLQDFWQAHRGEDHDGSLQSAVLLQQGSIIKDSGDLPGALKAFRAVNAKPEDRFFYLLLAYCLAKTLDEIGEPQDAFNELTHRLNEAGSAHDKSDLGLVTFYMGLVARLGRDVPPRHRDLVRDAIRAWEIPLTDSESQNPEKLIAALTAANEKRREFAANQRTAPISPPSQRRRGNSPR
jgi:tetratricopeptide (TPR) repeat protein